jgi:nicotinamidase-related amidase
VGGGRSGRLQRGDALLLINPLNFTGAARVLPWARRLIAPLRRVARAARAAGTPVIYINDHHGVWSGDRADVVRRCTRAGVPGRDVSARLTPRRGDRFLIKPRHSAFFATPLAVLNSRCAAWCSRGSRLTCASS